MLRDQPLMCLFIAATVVVDLVALAAPELPVWGTQGLFALMLGQAAALAHWAANGRTHRLARGAWLVVAVGILIYLVSNLERDQIGRWITLLEGYVLFLVFIAVLANSFRSLSAKSRDSASSTERWQISLIEIFGWTILVAIASFSARYMEFQVFRRAEVLWGIAPIFAMPSIIILWIKNDLRDLNIATALSIAAVFCGVGFLMEFDLLEVWLIAIQTAYLVAWFLVRGFDNVMCEARAVSEAAADELADCESTE